jgi:hypothetical protein
MRNRKRVMEKVQFINVQIILGQGKSCLDTKVMENLIGSQFTGKQRKRYKLNLVNWLI